MSTPSRFRLVSFTSRFGRRALAWSAVAGAAGGWSAFVVRAADTPTVVASPAPMVENPLLTESTLPYHYPPFDKIKDDDFAPAFEQGMADQLKEVDVIAANKEAATFDNTVVALERSGQTFARVNRIFSSLAGANTNPTLQ